MSKSDQLHQSQEFYQQFFGTSRKLSYDDYERYQVVFELINSLALPSSATVLDIGAGAGKISRFLAERFDKVISVDITATPLMKNILPNYPQIKFSTAALPGFPFPDQKFDLVVCSEVLEHIEQELQPFSVIEIARMITPGGWSIISTPNPQSIFEVVRKTEAVILRRNTNRTGQLLESYISPKILQGLFENHFLIKRRLGSFYLFPPLSGFASKLPLLYKVSEDIRRKGWLNSKGLYQYYVLKRK
ncbi:MAG: class I SAM-dependent methyltransferase [Anaerolineae bacterium]|nr:class I SAM-dependent methyltransferase [Anaerolineae bacterium]